MTEIFDKEFTPEEIADMEAYEAGAYDREVAAVEQRRQHAYQIESDPLFFKYQRDEDGVTKQVWLEKIDEIRARFPMPEQPKK